ncbi:uncharacterized protein LOC124930751 isoform X2 [Impatiens glandulifera]|uniref:uncharacterized protein LOC124930751 isoform X2 n=1 Tax=Impatiens glandulifera TaxID=253017 RepID=UPI001FB095EB|nr:uncharacterized protein LOC124930751 isoform X2 [Impatiens glandulifera]
MKEVDKKITPNNNQKKYSGRSQRRERKLPLEHASNTLIESEAESKSSSEKLNPSPCTLSQPTTEPVEVYKNMVIHYADDDDDTSRLEEPSQENKEEISANSIGLEREEKKENGEPDPDGELQNSIESNEGLTEIASSKNVKIHPCSVNGEPVHEVKEVDVLEEASNDEHKEKPGMDKKIEEMEMRIQKLEEELREVAALEISLYSVVPEHGSSAHKVHTSARRLSRLYIHACKYWSSDKRATVARSAISGLIFVAKSSSNDVPRLSFWLSNTVVLREIISQVFGNSCSHSRIFEVAGQGKKSESKLSSLKWKGNSKQGFTQFLDDWQETSTFIATLEKVEYWIFNRIVESIWWQALTPNMQSPTEKTNSGKMLSSDDHEKGSYSIDLWKNAFEDALKRLCPVRAGGHECGCLPALSRKVMEQCVSRLDVAMFNAILRESAHEIPTDPLSDPIIDPNVLPIPAGDLSFGSGAQLKNSIGNWSRLLVELFGTNEYDSSKENEQINSDDDNQGGNVESKHFNLLSSLSDLLMLPKDMLINRPVREEVCPSIGLPLVKRILCNFTPDEFCPDPVPGAVLESLNAECLIERRISGESAGSFPYRASPVIYTPPCSKDVAEKVAEAGTKSHQLSRNASVIQRKGYTSDEELEELQSPLTSFIQNFPSSPSVDVANGRTVRYELLREVWN